MERQGGGDSGGRRVLLSIVGPEGELHELCCEWLVPFSTYFFMCHVFAFE